MIGKYRNVSFIGKLQEGVEIVEAAIEDPEFKALSVIEQELLTSLCFNLYLLTNRLLQRAISNE